MNRNPLNTIMAPSAVAFLVASNTLGKMGTSQLLNALYMESIEHGVGVNGSVLEAMIVDRANINSEGHRT